uniref:Carboxylic ester hydrolase n=1 Tax=Panagrolaimus sp. ES5 TaxID=591445 RepID=A0AC34FGQ0_9BILA
MVGPWNGEFLATNLSTTCFLTKDTAFPDFPGAEMWNPFNTMDEDCLSMNIWVPRQHDGTVMVWIYGGGFSSGSPSLDLYDGKVLAVMEKTIVININYRLGAFGFLYFGDDTPVNGNMGLVDQQIALKWINENIEYFGGDKNRVTLFGESAGGASATAHLFAPESWNYFNKFICNSGVILNSWATKPKNFIKNLSLKLAKKVGCIPNDNNDVEIKSDQINSILKCMAEVKPNILQEKANEVSFSLTHPMAFAFVPIEEDNHFFQGNVFEKFYSQNFKKNVSAIFGTVTDEGTYWLPYYLYDTGFRFNHTVSAEDVSNQALISRSDYQASIDKFMPYFGNSVLVRHALLNAYQQVSNASNENARHRDGVARFVGDYFFTCRLIEFANVLADNIYGNVFMYQFTRRSSANPWPKWMGSMHGYEIEFEFGRPFRKSKIYSEPDLEKNISKKIMHYWKEFIVTGRPVSTWPKYNRISQQTFILNEKIASSDDGDIEASDKSQGKYCLLLKEASDYRMPNCGFSTSPIQDIGAVVSSALINSASSSPTLTILSINFFTFLLIT